MYGPLPYGKCLPFTGAPADGPYDLARGLRRRGALDFTGSASAGAGVSFAPSGSGMSSAGPAGGLGVVEASGVAAGVGGTIAGAPGAGTGLTVGASGGGGGGAGGGMWEAAGLAVVTAGASAGVGGGAAGEWWCSGGLAAGLVTMGTNSPGRHVWGWWRTVRSRRNSSACPQVRQMRAPSGISPRVRSDRPAPIVPVLRSFAQTKSVPLQFVQTGATRMRLYALRAGRRAL